MHILHLYLWINIHTEHQEEQIYNNVFINVQIILIWNLISASEIDIQLPKFSYLYS